MIKASALSYLAALEVGAELATHDLQAASAAERVWFLMSPPYLSRDVDPAERAGNDPTNVVGGQILSALGDRLRAAERTYQLVAWWWASAAVETLSRHAAGKTVTARLLERVTLQGDDRPKPGAWPWLEKLPADGEFELGQPRLDDPMRRALADLRAAYGAAHLAEALERDFEEDEERTPGYVSEQEAGQLHDLFQRTDRIPDLLIAYARAASAVVRTTARTGDGE